MSLKTRNKISANFNMSSLTDIIFLLLIFFMLTSTLVAPNAIKLLLPRATGQTLARQSIFVNITKDIEYFVNNKKVTLSTLHYELLSQIQSKGDLTVVIRSDKSVPVESLVQVLSIGNKLKVKMILATQPEK